MIRHGGFPWHVPRKGRANRGPLPTSSGAGLRDGGEAGRCARPAAPTVDAAGPSDALHSPGAWTPAAAFPSEAGPNRNARRGAAVGRGPSVQCRGWLPIMAPRNRNKGTWP